MLEPVQRIAPLDWRIPVQLLGVRHGLHPWSAPGNEQLHCGSKPLVVVDASHLHHHQVRNYIWFCRERRSAPSATAAAYPLAARANVLKDRRFAFEPERRTLNEDNGGK